MKAIALIALIIASAMADFYMHNPPGSNNRYNEANNNRDNANRLFDSQNNGAGGYNYPGTMYYYGGSVLSIEWTNQHACGDNPKTYCQIVLQYMCEDTGGAGIRDGQNTNTVQNPEENPPDYNRGRHEPYQFYRACEERERNKGLFISDRNLNGDEAIYTRQNNNGNRHGYECPEERDYYPYWHPTPWVDIAVVTNDIERCPYYQAESQNVRAKGQCSDVSQNNQVSCEQAGATWQELGQHQVDPPACVYAPYSRDNHLGNTVGGYPSMFNWTLPLKSADTCVIRGRYNISTAEYDGWDVGTVNSGQNGADTLLTPSGYYLNDNPAVDIDGPNGETVNVQLAMNTNQYGRTFEDRCHVFSVYPRPEDIPKENKIWNLNVRGKRGNIVQVYPNVEYDYVPNRLVIRPGDYVHFQWGGSNTNDNGNAGEGTAGTDRSNLVQIANAAMNYPLRVEQHTMFGSPDDPVAKDLVRRFATIGDQDDQLNNAGPYFDGGLVQFNKKGTFHYMCTRNNNFSNRSQKGTMVVDDKAGVGPKPRGGDVGKNVGIAFGVIIGVVAVIAGGYGLSLLLKKRNNGSADFGRFNSGFRA